MCKLYSDTLILQCCQNSESLENDLMHPTDVFCSDVSVLLMYAVWNSVGLHSKVLADPHQACIWERLCIIFDSVLAIKKKSIESFRQFCIFTDSSSSHLARKFRCQQLHYAWISMGLCVVSEIASFNMHSIFKFNSQYFERRFSCAYRAK